MKCCAIGDWWISNSLGFGVCCIQGEESSGCLGTGYSAAGIRIFVNAFRHIINDPQAAGGGCWINGNSDRRSISGVDAPVTEGRAVAGLIDKDLISGTGLCDPDSGSIGHEVLGIIVGGTEAE